MQLPPMQQLREVPPGGHRAAGCRLTALPAECWNHTGMQTQPSWACFHIPHIVHLWFIHNCSKVEIPNSVVISVLFQMCYSSDI